MIRNRSLDIAKGIAIILVVLGHCYSRFNYISYWINGMHMPFFFIASGVLYAKQVDRTFGLRDFLTKAQKLLLPYFVFELLYTGYLFTAKYLAGGLSIEYIISTLTRVINLSGVQSTWFLPCLLGVIGIYMLFYKIGKKCCAIVMILLMILSYFIYQAGAYLVVIKRCMNACGFFSIGLITNEFLLKKRHYFVVLLAIIAYSFFVAKNNLVIFANCEYGCAYLYLFNALLGSFVLFQCALRINQLGRSIEYLRRLGQDSCIVLCTHAFIIEAIRLLDHKVFESVLPKLQLCEGFVICGIVLLIEIPVMSFFNNYSCMFKKKKV